MKEVAYHSGSDKAKVQSVLLLTDGLATNGVTTKDGILAKMLTIQKPEDKSKKVDIYILIIFCVVLPSAPIPNKTCNNMGSTNYTIT